MTSEQALKIFDIQDLMSETEETVKKKYKRLMVKYHPDVCGDDTKAKDIIEAYSNLKELLVKLNQIKLVDRKLEIVSILLPINKLVEIYGGNDVFVGNNRKVNNKNIRKFNVLIMTDIELTHNGISTIFSNIEPMRVDDTYEVNCEIYVDTLDNTEDVKLNINNKERIIKVTSQSVKFKCSLDYNTYVNVIITKKTRVDNKEKQESNGKI